tara:strand:+ start:319 stop:1041 length:723 start_codon:yes stop_codon:yes gene_type:complete
MGSPVRFPFGVTNVDKTSPFAMMGQLSPLTFHTYFNDFDEYVVTSRWTETKVGAGTVAVTDVDGGAILITNAAADDDSVFVQKLGESFLLASGKKVFFEARFTVSDATQSDWIFGLYITDTTPLAASGDGVTDGIFFQKDDGDTNIDFYVQNNTTTGQLTTTAITTASAAATFMRLAFFFDGKRYVHVYKDGVELSVVDLTATLATYLPDTELTIGFGIQNGEAVAKTMTIDYVFVAEER